MRSVVKTAATWAVVVLSVSVISACSKEPPAPIPTTAAQPTATPSPTPTVAPEVAEARQAVKDVALRYEALMNKLDMDAASVSNAEIDAVTINTETQRVLERQKMELEKGWKASGPSMTTQVIIRSLSLVNKPTSTPPEVPIARIVTCWDITGVNYVDNTGGSRTSPDRPRTGTTEFTVENYKYPDKTQWRVSELTALTPGEKCPEK